MKRMLLTVVCLCATPVALGQANTPKLPCEYRGPLLQTSRNEAIHLNTDAMKKRATHKEDLPGLVRQIDGRSLVIVDVLVGPDGDVVCAKALSGSQIFAEPTRRALALWKFKPEQQNGAHVAYLGRMEFFLCNTECGDAPFGVTLMK